MPALLVLQDAPILQRARTEPLLIPSEMRSWCCLLQFGRAGAIAAPFWQRRPVVLVHAPASPVNGMLTNPSKSNVPGCPAARACLGPAPSRRLSQVVAAVMKHLLLVQIAGEGIGEGRCNKPACSPTTTMQDENMGTAMVTPASASAYCSARFPKKMQKPENMAKPMDEPFSCNTAHRAQGAAPCAVIRGQRVAMLKCAMHRCHDWQPC